MQASLLSFAVPMHKLGRDKAARKAADRELLEWQQHRAPRLGLRWPPKPQNARRAGRPSFCQAVDACAGAGRSRWSFDQACRSGEASRRLAQTWQTRFALLMHRRTLTPNRLRSLRMACCGPSQRKRARRNECSLAVRARFCNLTACHPGWTVAECIRYAKRMAPELFPEHNHESGCGQATRSSGLQSWEQPT